MFTLEDLRREAAGVPMPASIGLGGLLVATLADTLAHLGSAGHHAHDGGFTPVELASHIALVVSMALILVGVVADGVHASRARRRAERTRKDVA